MRRSAGDIRGHPRPAIAYCHSRVLREWEWEHWMLTTAACGVRSDSRPRDKGANENKKGKSSGSHVRPVDQVSCVCRALLSDRKQLRNLRAKRRRRGFAFPLWIPVESCKLLKMGVLGTLLPKTKIPTMQMNTPKHIQDERSLWSVVVSHLWNVMHHTLRAKRRLTIANNRLPFLLVGDRPLPSCTHVKVANEWDKTSKEILRPWENHHLKGISRTS